MVGDGIVCFPGLEIAGARRIVHALPALSSCSVLWNDLGEKGQRAQERVWVIDYDY